MENLEFVDYTDESMLKDIQFLAARDLSEPYSIFTYRYFLHNWPNLCICVYKKENNQREMIGTIVAKLEGTDDDKHGYIAMLVVDQVYRKQGIAMTLVKLLIERMASLGCKELILETEASNTAALGLYLKLGFVKDEKLTRYYLNGGDAYRLKLWIDKPI